MPDGIRDVLVDMGENQQRQEVRVTFGPQYGLQILEEDGEVRFRLVATHHGFEAAASGDPSGELKQIIDQVQKDNEDLTINRFLADEED